MLPDLLNELIGVGGLSKYEAIVWGGNNDAKLLALGGSNYFQYTVVAVF